jgi:hypothetical protein
MLFLTFSAYLRLIQFDFFVAHNDFQMLYRKVRNQSIHNGLPSATDVERICLAMDMACIWYWKEVLCLQRSAATACLLRESGFPAQMVIGTQQMPFQAHAWVEVDGHVVNDKPYIPDMYAVLDRL